MDAEIPRERHPGLRSAAVYAAAVVACALLLCWLYRLPGRDLRVPISYSGDALDCYLYGKMVADTGWTLGHPGLGTPHGLGMQDFQHASTLQFGLMWLLSFATPDPFLLITLYFLATFPLAALTCLGVLRCLGVGRLPALAAAVLFAFLPYHHLRGVSHLFLANYFAVPLGALLTLWAWSDEPLFGGGWRRIGTRGVAALLLAIVVGSSAVYYAFFTCALLATAAVVRCCRSRRLSAGVGPAAVAAIIALTVLVNLAPQWLYVLQNGPNPEAVRRFRGVQKYDLRISQLLAPTTGHRIPFVARAKDVYNAHIPAFTENDTASLGLVASVGFLFLLGRLLYTAGSISPLDSATRANAAALLLGTMGGFGSMLALGLPLIRCYNRLSVFVAFFALFAVAHLLDRLLARRGAVGRFACLALCIVLVAVGVWDETPAGTAVPDPLVESRFASDADFVRRIEAEISPGGMILQFPHISYPEGRGYDHLRLSLHSRSSRWSFPAMRGRYADLWQRQACGQDVPTLLRQLCDAGFVGIACDREVMTPDEALRERQLAGILGAPVLASADGRFAFYPLAGYASGLGIGSDPGADEEARILALHPVLLSWGKGFEPPKDSEAKSSGSRWGGVRAELSLVNALDYERAVILQLSVRSNPGTIGTVRVTGPGLDLSEKLSAQSRDLRLPIAVPPGRCTVAFECDAPEEGGRRFDVASWRVLPVPPAPEVACGH